MRFQVFIIIISLLFVSIYGIRKKKKKHNGQNTLKNVTRVSRDYFSYFYGKQRFANSSCTYAIIEFSISVSVSIYVNWLTNKRGK